MSAEFIATLQAERERLEAARIPLVARLEALDTCLRVYRGDVKKESFDVRRAGVSPAPRLAPARGDPLDNEIARLWREGKSAVEIAATVSRHVVTIYAHLKKLSLPLRRGPRRLVPPKRRFDAHFEAKPESVTGLPPDHPALKERRTMFQSTVIDAEDSPRLLVSGANSRKLGDRVAKGAWAGMRIVSLALEERATCPDSCHHWSTCYGNGMPFARRHRPGAEFQARLEDELRTLAAAHPRGFVVRLHTLGDFYSTEYVAAWTRWLDEIPPLRAFGYTAWPVDSEIGAMVADLRDRRWDRFAVRTSIQLTNDKLVDGSTKIPTATTIWRKPEGARVAEGIVCPAQTGRTECCGTCGLCWADAAREETIAFIAHGQSFIGGERPAAAEARPFVQPAEACA